jgi:hypothetical protein
LCERIRAERNPFPVDALGRHRDDIAILVHRRIERQRLVGRQQRLDLLRRKRQWIGERRIVRKLDAKRLQQGGAFACDRRKALSVALLGRRIALRGWF